MYAETPISTSAPPSAGPGSTPGTASHSDGCPQAADLRLHHGKERFVIPGKVVRARVDFPRQPRIDLPIPASAPRPARSGKSC